jgi:RNA polymerase sigma factor (sigma-70 family)
MAIAWREILAEHGSRVWQTVYRVLNHHEDALDCYQDVLVSAQQYAERHEIQDWGTFLTSLAAKRAIDRLRQRIRQRTHQVALDSIPEPATETDCPVERAAAAELMERARRWMAMLSEKQAEVFWLCCIEGLSHQQVGLQMQITELESRVLLHRARSRLGEALGSALLGPRSKQ